MSHFFKKRSPMQLLALGFFILILIGTVLLMLPVSSRQGTVTPFITALFTSTSASCVTGLTVVDTSAHWSVFGQAVLLCLIQIGGLGFITMGTALTLLLGKRIGLTQRGRIRESLNIGDIADLKDLMQNVLKGTFFTEAAGALVLALRFYPKMGLRDAVWFGVFHSVSAFCNAGFDLLGKYAMASFSGYRSDPVVVVTLCLLILIGGTGFVVWQDIKTKKCKPKRYSLQTKIVLTASLLLVFGGAVLFYLIEKGNTFAPMDTKGKVLSALFCSVTPRTAGFYVIDYGKMTESGKFITVLLMFIGGGSGSTAGGVKITTVFVLLFSLKSTVTRAEHTVAYKRRIDDATIAKAFSLAGTYIALIALSVAIITAAQNFSVGDTLFEVTSAVCTVGVTAGLTAKLNLLSRLVIIFLMYLGRINGLSFALSFTDHKKAVHITRPAEKVSIG